MGLEASSRLRKEPRSLLAKATAGHEPRQIEHFCASRESLEQRLHCFPTPGPRGTGFERALHALQPPYRGLFPSPPLFDRMPTYRTQGKRSLNFLSATWLLRVSNWTPRTRCPIGFPGRGSPFRPCSSPGLGGSLDPHRRRSDGPRRRRRGLLLDSCISTVDPRRLGLPR